jgi:hypothetical protein
MNLKRIGWKGLEWNYLAKIGKGKGLLGKGNEFTGSVICRKFVV